jgi:HlyD family secretion protein
MNADKLNTLRIDSNQKRRSQASFWIIVVAVLAITIIAILIARPWSSDDSRLVKTGGVKPPTNSAPSAVSNPTGTNASLPVKPGTADDVVLTVSGYIINRERIEISPRFLGQVKWIGVKKGDAVTNGQIVVLLDDAEYKARLAQADGSVASAIANVNKAQLAYDRIKLLAHVESQQSLDDARLTLEAAKAVVKEMEGVRALAQTYLDWCTIRSPVNGVVLERLVDPNELVVPQSFGGGRGPSTALLAVADPKDLQVEIDVSEANLSKISLNQKCRVSPEAYPDKQYQGYVAEIAPQADRAKGTLQIKVQIREPDQFLTPELSAKVDFLKQ